MGTNCASLVVDLFLFCYGREFIVAFSDDKQADIIDTISRYSNVISNINIIFFENMVSQIYPAEL